MKKLLVTLTILIALTIITAIISSATVSYVVIVILLLAVLKFIGVSFYFMDLRHANVFWKGSILIFLALFLATILIII
ncbi:cytochrome C oxidase subunit IV family protein [Pontimicrobium sp. SW4]|uniref:Cytochrome C oxidase subunit IV family protein n=1 Tax=Pontimicrobium sp. SW4 TaxID=3153519 RepID=A0AAU7BU28_9FLAO